MNIDDLQLISLWGIIFTLLFITATLVIIFVRNLIITANIFKGNTPPSRESIEFAHNLHVHVLVGQFFGLIFWLGLSILILIFKH